MENDIEIGINIIGKLYLHLENGEETYIEDRDSFALRSLDNGMTEVTINYNEEFSNSFVVKESKKYIEEAIKKVAMYRAIGIDAINEKMIIENESFSNK